VDVGARRARLALRLRVVGRGTVSRVVTGGLTGGDEPRRRAAGEVGPATGASSATAVAPLRLRLNSGGRLGLMHGDDRSRRTRDGPPRHVRGERALRRPKRIPPGDGPVARDA